MIEELHVRDLALIEDVWLEFGDGLTVLTGETGAGKTALLGALKLLLGERADSQAVRPGAAEALVEGRFTTPDAEIVVRRRVSADGRSRCMVDDEMSTVGALAQTVGPLVDLHGQHDHQALLSAATHSRYLDGWIGAEAVRAVDEYRTALAAHRAAVGAREALEARLLEGERAAEYLRFVLEEIERVSPLPGEDAELEARLPALQHGEKLSEAATCVARALRGEGGALDLIAEARHALARVEGIDPSLDSLAVSVDALSAQVDDCGVTARSYRDGIEHDPKALDQTLARLAALNGLKKKYGPSLEDVLGRLEEARATLAASEDSEEARRAAEKDVQRAESGLRRAGDHLDEVRKQAAPGFTAALSAAAADLSMGAVSFDISFVELPFNAWHADGPHRLEFLFAPAAGQAPRSLSRIASGGEISRVMLALKSVLGAADSVGTLVFDEIDAGIGGSTAHAVGRRLAELAEVHQVIVVTHLAQVAAYADRHLVVTKRIDGDRPVTGVEPVSGDDRVEEIARMLSGSDSSASLAHARELLDGVSGRRESA